MCEGSSILRSAEVIQRIGQYRPDRHRQNLPIISMISQDKQCMGRTNSLREIGCGHDENILTMLEFVQLSEKGVDYADRVGRFIARHGPSSRSR